MNRPPALPGVTLTVALLTSAIATPQQGETEQEQKLVWTCPLHGEVTETEAGQCQFCERQLVHTLVQLAWSCPIHAVVVESESGQCPICQRDLFPITEEVCYVCPMHPEEDVFRVYLFNNFSEPLNTKEFKGGTTRKLGSPKGLLSKTRVCSRSICRRATPRSLSTRWP